MSRHHIRLMHEGQAVLVVAGYDRPLHELFLQVFRCHKSMVPGKDEIVYDSLHEPGLDWTDIGTLTEKLSNLEICVPQELIEAVYLDQRFNAGNTVVKHHIDQAPKAKTADGDCN